MGWKFSKTTPDKIWKLQNENKQDPLLVVANGCVKTPVQRITSQQEIEPHDADGPTQALKQSSLSLKGRNPAADPHLDAMTLAQAHHLMIPACADTCCVQTVGLVHD